MKGRSSFTPLQWRINWKGKFGEEAPWFWKLSTIEKMYRAEHPEWSDAEVAARSQRLYDAQCEMDRDWYNSQRRFHRNYTLYGAGPDEADDPDALANDG